MRHVAGIPTVPGLEVLPQFLRILRALDELLDLVDLQVVMPLGKDRLLLFVRHGVPLLVAQVCPQRLPWGQLDAVEARVRRVAQQGFQIDLQRHRLPLVHRVRRVALDAVRVGLAEERGRAGERLLPRLLLQLLLPEGQPFVGRLAGAREFQQVPVLGLRQDIAGQQPVLTDGVQRFFGDVGQEFHRACGLIAPITGSAIFATPAESSITFAVLMSPTSTAPVGSFSSN